MSKVKFIGDIVHTEKYTDRETGEEKKKYNRAGALFQRDDGSFTIKQYDTWFNVYPPKAKEGDYAQAKQTVQQTQTVGHDVSQDDIPFALVMPLVSASLLSAFLSLSFLV